MKEKSKKQRSYPEVQVLGDLSDVKKLVKAVNKKNTIVIFRNGETGSLHARVDHDILQYAEEDIRRLSKKYKLVYFDFFPGRQPDDPAATKQEY